MGIVLNQSFKNLVTTYVGFAVGALNVLLLYPNFLSKEYYGLVTFLLSTSTLIWPLMGLGVHNTLIKFYSSYQSETDQQKLLSFVLFFPIVIAAVLGCLGYLSYDAILSYFNKNTLVKPFVWQIFAIALTSAYFEVFFSWSKLKFKSVFGNFMREVFHRVCITLLLVLVYLDKLSVEGFVYSLTGVYAARTLIIMGYAFYVLPPVIHFKMPYNKKSVYKYSFLIFIAGTVATTLLDLDKFMIEHYLPIEQVSIYGIAVYVASVIGVPSKAMLQIVNPITASLLNQQQYQQLDTMYKKSSVSLLVVSGLIFALIIANIEALYQLMPKGYAIATYIVLLLCLVKLFTSLLGNNGSIIFNSEYYRWVLIMGVATIVLAIVLNIWLLPILGLLGAAIASFATFLLYHTSKLLLVYKKLNMHPFTDKTLKVVSLIAGISTLFYFIKLPISPWLSIPFKSIVLGLLYVGICYKFHFSDDINALLSKVLKKQAHQK